MTVDDGCLSDSVGEKGEKKSAFPKSLFFIIGNEFCERYSFYGMRTILILYLTIFLKFSDDQGCRPGHWFSLLTDFSTGAATSFCVMRRWEMILAGNPGADTATIIYHSFIAVAYFVPLIGGIVADSWLGKYKTILYLSLVYVVGTLFNALSAIPQLGGYGNSVEDNIVHVALHITGLV